MSTSKIGRAIKTRDVVTPGFSDNKKKKPKLELKQDVDNLLELYNDLESLYKEQRDTLENLNEKVVKLQATNSAKQVVINGLERELKDKDSTLEDIKLMLSTVESKVNVLESNFESVKKTLEDKDKSEKHSKWNIFKD